MAQNLEALYDYSLRRLILANAHNDDAMLEEVAHLFEPIAQGWNQIKTPTAAAVAPRTEMRLAMVGA